MLITEQYMDSERPAGSINGSNKIYTLDYEPSPSSSLDVYYNGILQVQGGEDYTLSAKEITFINAPIGGSVLRAFYRY